MDSQGTSGLSFIPSQFDSDYPAVSSSAYRIKIYNGRDLLARSILPDLRTLINAAYQVHDINSLGEVGERLHYNDQIVDEIGITGFTVVISTSDEIVGTASVKGWVTKADGIIWNSGGYYTAKSAEEASLMNAISSKNNPSLHQPATCEGDYEIFMVAIRPGIQYRKKGIADRLV